MMNEASSDKIATFSAARREVWKPFLIIVLAAAGIVAVTALLAVGHIGLVVNTMVVTICLFPMLIVMLPLFVGVIVGIWALVGVDKAAVGRLLQAEQAAKNAKVSAQATSYSVGQRFVALASSVERLEPLWRIFDRKPETKGRSDAAQPAKPDQPAES